MCGTRFKKYINILFILRILTLNLPTFGMLVALAHIFLLLVTSNLVDVLSLGHYIIQNEALIPPRSETHAKYL